MPKRSSKSDINQIASRIVHSVTEPAKPMSDDRPKKKNPAAVALGRLGGKKGGPARAKKLSSAQRSAIAKFAAHARWGQS